MMTTAATTAAAANAQPSARLSGRLAHNDMSLRLRSQRTHLPAEHALRAQREHHEQDASEIGVCNSAPRYCAGELLPDAEHRAADKGPHSCGMPPIVAAMKAFKREPESHLGRGLRDRAAERNRRSPRCRPPMAKARTARPPTGRPRIAAPSRSAAIASSPGPSAPGGTTPHTTTVSTTAMTMRMARCGTTSSLTRDATARR